MSFTGERGRLANLRSEMQFTEARRAAELVLEGGPEGDRIYTDFVTLSRAMEVHNTLGSPIPLHLRLSATTYRSRFGDRGFRTVTDACARREKEEQK